ncbi:MAG: energy transducer TonB [Acidobacteria bacterium]|nr:energy transducer TonB [Acidobacteriota bacterium]
MPLNVRRFCSAVFVNLLVLIFIAQAQDVPTAPTSGDVMRDRISKAKAYIAVRNYNAAIYELENIRKETADVSVQGVVNVLLMNSYLEQGDFKRAQEFLNVYFTAQKSNKANAAAFYNAIAGQVVKDAKNRAERYRSLGLSVSDRTLPLEVLNDLEKMRETLELVIEQSKEISKTPARSADAMAMLEEASNSRSILARDDYDARKWKDEVADTREQMVNTRSVVSAVTESPLAAGNTSTVAANTKPAITTPVVMQPVVETKQQTVRDREVKQTNTKPADNTVAKNDKPIIIRSAPAKEQPQPTPPADNTAASNDGSPLDVGSLIPYATKQAQPTYPPAAKTMRATGVVKVEFTVDEKGEVAEVRKASGPTMLQGAAKDAILKWRFKPFMRDGQPVRANGFVSFNFNL